MPSLMVSVTEHIDGHIFGLKILKKNRLIEQNNLNSETNQKSEPRKNFVLTSKKILGTWYVLIMPQQGLEKNGLTL